MYVMPRTVDDAETLERVAAEAAVECKRAGRLVEERVHRSVARQASDLQRAFRVLHDSTSNVSQFIGELTTRLSGEQMSAHVDSGAGMDKMRDLERARLDFLFVRRALADAIAIAKSTEPRQ